MFFPPIKVVFLLGMVLYKREVVAQSKNIILLDVIVCTYTGVKYKLKNVREHTWIDGSREFYSASFVQDVGVILKVRFKVQHYSFRKSTKIQT